MNENSIDRLFRRFADDGDVAALAAVFDRLAPEVLVALRRE